MKASNGLVASSALLSLALWTAGAAEASSAGGRQPLFVQVDRHAHVYIDGTRVDTLEVHRRQWVYWATHAPSSPDLSIQFERKLLHPRHRITITVSGGGKPASTKIHIRARPKTYAGRPVKGFAADLPESAVIPIRVVPSPEK